MVQQIKVKTKCKIRSKTCTYRMNETNTKTYRYLLKKEGMPSGGIPKLRRLSLLEYLLGVPQESPSLSSCLSSFFSHRDLLDHQTLHPHKTSTENSVRSVSIIKEITTLSTVANQFIFCFFIVSTVIYLFHGLIH